MMTPLQAGEMFLALRLHFTRPSYDYFKYHGKTTLTHEKFEQRSDKFLFAKLTRIYQTAEEYRDLIVANCLDDPHLYSRLLLSSEAHERYLAYRKIHESLTYQVNQDYCWLFEENSDLNFWLRSENEWHDYPPLMRAVWSQRIKIETLLVMNRILNFLPVWERKIRDTIRAPEFLLLCRKYDPFVVVDATKAKTILREKIMQTI